jgi:hypothetical protein
MIFDCNIQPLWATDIKLGRRVALDPAYIQGFGKMIFHLD